MIRRYAILAVAGVIFSAGSRVRGQSVANVVDAIDHARVSTRILYVTAHPDDERSSVLTYLSKGLGDTVALCSTTRGEGGQNAIGPELGPALKILRTDELYRATQDYGVQLFFTRAPDFGYSKSADETLKIWNGIAKEDLVRVIRTFRPNIIINQWGGVHTGHGQHQATGIVVPLAVQAANDPSAYADQFREGLRPWHVDHVLQFVFGRSGNQQAEIQLPVGEISPLWGESYADLGLVGFANHRSQGITRILDSSFFRRPVDLTVVQGDPMKLEDLAQSLFYIAAGSNALEVPLGSADGSLVAARQAALRLDWAKTVRYLSDAGKQIQSAVKTAQSDPATDGNALWALEQERQRIDAAVVAAAALHVDGEEAEQGTLVASESFSVRVNWYDRSDVGVQLDQPSLQLPHGWTSSVENSSGNAAASGAVLSFNVQVPTDAEPPSSPQDAVLPWPAPLVQVHMTGNVNGYAFSLDIPVIAHEYTSTTVETMPLELVPAVTLSVDPDQIMLPANRSSRAFQLLARIHYHGKAPVRVETGVRVPENWNVTPASSIEFPGPGDRLARFTVTPPEGVLQGAYELKPYARLGSKTFTSSYEALPSLPSRHVSESAVAEAHVLDLTIPANLRIGYVAAGIDPVPESLRQLGINVTMLDEAALAFGDLSHFDAIVIGIRAYELRPDLMSANHRLLDYVQNGGTLVVQYERDFAWNKLLPAPFRATMDQPAERITDENSPVRFVDANRPLLNYPNRISEKDFRGWIQERGLYFLGQWDSRYRPVLAMHDPGESDALGGLLWARDGKGVYIYTGLAFFRQLPAGVPGAYRLFVNLLCASRGISQR